MFENREKIKKYLLIAFAIIIAYVLYKIFNFMAPFIICALLIYLLAPVVNFISNYPIKGKNIPRGLSVIIIYLVFFGLLTLICMIIFPLLYSEGIKIASDLPKQLNHFKNESLPVLLANFQKQLDIYGIDVDIQDKLDQAIESVLASGQGYIEEIPKFVQDFIGGFFSALTSFIVVFIFTAFILIDLPNIRDTFISFVPPEYKPGLLDLGNSINRDLNGAIRGQLVICVINGILTTFGLIILKVKYPFIIGLIAGVFSLIPVFGTIFSTIPAILVSATQSWLIALEVLILILIIHLIEANLLNPKIMGTSVELHPAIIIFSIFAGEHLFGIPGLLLAVPVVAIVRSIIKYIYIRYFTENNTNTDIIPEGNIKPDNLVLVIHGGAGTIIKKEMSAEQEKAYRATLKEALTKGYQVLKNGGTSMDAVETTIKVMEDSPLFNAGKGAVFTHEGTNEMDASIMDGNTLKAGAVAGVTIIKNPISAARVVMEKSPHVMMAGKGADEFAKSRGVETVEPSYFFTQFRFDQLKAIQDSEKIELDHSGKENKSDIKKKTSPEFHEKKFGTVGAVALDQFGNLAAGTSTGGITNQGFGRIGDSPVIGAGTYANNNTCAVSATGYGDFFIRTVVSHDISALMEYKGFSVDKAAQEVVLKKLVKMGAKGGVIALDRKGNLTMTFNSEGMYRGYVKSNGKVKVFIYK